MTAEGQYQKLLDKIFGENAITIPLKGNKNDIIGAFMHKEDSNLFLNNFENRLIRLRDKYKSSTGNYYKLLEKIKNVSIDRNWEGAYSELVALDILNEFTTDAIDLDTEILGKDCFANECGKKGSDEDGYWRDYDAYFDIKTLADPVKQILNNIIDKAKANLQVIPIDIQYDYQADVDSTLYENNTAKLTQELSNCLRLKKKTLSSNIVDGLTYHIQWEAGVNIGESSYNPFRHAAENKNLFLKRYAAKFSKRKPTFIVMVYFPWFKEVISDFCDMNKIFYRTIARRTFCQYLHSNSKMSMLNNAYSNTTTIRKLSKYLSGIIFIEDLSIKKDSYNIYIYINPNAKYKLRHSMKIYFDELFRRATSSEYDDFEYDNY